MAVDVLDVADMEGIMPSDVALRPARSVQIERTTAVGRKKRRREGGGRDGGDLSTFERPFASSKSSVAATRAPLHRGLVLIAQFNLI